MWEQNHAKCPSSFQSNWLVIWWSWSWSWWRPVSLWGFIHRKRHGTKYLSSVLRQKANIIWEKCCANEDSPILFQDSLGILPPETVAFVLDAPRCPQMLPDAPRCSQMLPDAPRSSKSQWQRTTDQLIGDRTISAWGALAAGFNQYQLHLKIENK